MSLLDYIWRQCEVVEWPCEDGWRGYILCVNADDSRSTQFHERELLGEMTIPITLRHDPRIRRGRFVVRFYERNPGENVWNFKTPVLFTGSLPPVRTVTRVEYDFSCAPSA